MPGRGALLGQDDHLLPGARGQTSRNMLSFWNQNRWARVKCKCPGRGWGNGRGGEWERPTRPTLGPPLLTETDLTSESKSARTNLNHSSDFFSATHLPTSWAAWLSTKSPTPRPLRVQQLPWAHHLVTIASASRKKTPQPSWASTDSKDCQSDSIQ